ncbi:hypothetical protein HYW21_06060 [Candidatus Woesearchaeota archaeon]|nr:hypothetical protein [Candidatus Woesearchaeota archaeon]
MDHHYRPLDLERLAACVPDTEAEYWHSSSRRDQLPLPVGVWQRLYTVVEILRSYDGWMPEGIHQFPGRRAALVHSPTPWAFSEMKKSFIDLLVYDLACSGLPEAEVFGLFQCLRRDYDVRMQVPGLRMKEFTLPEDLATALRQGYRPEVNEELADIALLEEYMGYATVMQQRRAAPQSHWIDNVLRGF